MNSKKRTATVKHGGDKLCFGFELRPVAQKTYIGRGENEFE